MKRSTANKMGKVLIVEDDPDISVITTARLKNAGFAVIAAADGLRGLEMASQEKPDLIFLDLGLPKMTGQAVCAALKSDERLKSIPVIIFSTNSDRIQEVVREIKADDYLRKPCAAESLIRIAQKYIPGENSSPV